MSKKSGGLFTLVTGIAMGAAAVFFSKEENRAKAQKTLATAKKKYEDDPSLALKDAVKQTKKVAKKVSTKAKTTAVKTATKKTAKKASSSTKKASKK